MFQNEWSPVRKTALWGGVPFVLVLILAGYLFIQDDPLGMGLAKLLAMIVVVLSFILYAIILGISFLISLLRIADKKTKGQMISGRFKWELIALLLILIALGSGVVWYRTYDPYAKKEWAMHQPENEFNSWQASISPLEIQSRPLK